MFGEPQPSSADLHFRLFGFPVRVHPFFWVIIALMGAGQRDLKFTLIWVAAAFLSILVHELGHAFALRWFGHRPWITLYGFGGLTSHNPGWGGRGTSGWAQVLISLAGPLAGFALAGVVLAGLYAARCQVVWAGIFWNTIYLPVAILNSMELTILVNDLFFVSILWGLFNLLPVYPLDGGQIARELGSMIHPYQGIRASMVLSIVVAGGISAYNVYLLLTSTRGPGGHFLQLVNSSAFFMALMFGALAYFNYQALQAYSGRRWG